MADDFGDAAFDAAIDAAKRKADDEFAEAEANGNWANWRLTDPNTSPPWWEAGAEWVWTILKAQYCWEDLTPITYRQVIEEAVDMLAIGLFDRVLRRYQDLAFGPHAPDMRKAFANHVVIRLLPRATERISGAVAKKPAETTPERSSPVVTPTKRYPRTIGTMAAARRMESHLETHGISMTDFAGTVGTTDRTLRKFRQTGRINRDTFDAIAKQMGLSRDELLNPGQ
jgi:hypothetical protein